MAEHIIEVRDDQFEWQVLQQDKPVIVDFWAPWCGPCKAMGPLFNALAKAHSDNMIFAKCNVDENPAVVQHYGIKAIPTLMIFRGGKVIHSITGTASQGALEEVINRAVTGEAPAPFIVS